MKTDSKVAAIDAQDDKEMLADGYNVTLPEDEIGNLFSKHLLRKGTGI